MTQNKKIAVTGGIGSGKSVVCELLRGRGYPVFSCDAVNRALLCDEDYCAGLARLFPACAKGTQIDKRALARLVFGDEAARLRLNAYAHPRIMARVLCEMEAAGGVSFAEVPLLFEGGFASQFDGVLVVLRAREARIEAIVRRDGCSRAEAEARIDSQFDYDRLPEGCMLLFNDGDRTHLAAQLETHLRRLQAN